MKKLPEDRSVWLYDGEPPGRGVPHMVIEVHKKDQTITTWSAFDQNPKNGGFSWLGSYEEFFQNFKPADVVGA